MQPRDLEATVRQMVLAEYMPDIDAADDELTEERLEDMAERQAKFIINQGTEAQLAFLASRGVSDVSAP